MEDILAKCNDMSTTQKKDLIQNIISQTPNCEKYRLSNVYKPTCSSCHVCGRESWKRNDMSYHFSKCSDCGKETCSSCNYCHAISFPSKCVKCLFPDGDYKCMICDTNTCMVRHFKQVSCKICNRFLCRSDDCGKRFIYDEYAPPYHYCVSCLNEKPEQIPDWVLNLLKYRSENI